jgi:hypothetical protein
MTFDTCNHAGRGINTLLLFMQLLFPFSKHLSHLTVAWEEGVAAAEAWSDVDQSVVMPRGILLMECMGHIVQWQVRSSSIYTSTHPECLILLLQRVMCEKADGAGDNGVWLTFDLIYCNVRVLHVPDASGAVPSVRLIQASCSWNVGKRVRFIFRWK